MEFIEDRKATCCSVSNFMEVGESGASGCCFRRRMFLYTFMLTYSNMACILSFFPTDDSRWSRLRKSWLRS